MAKDCAHGNRPFDSCSAAKLCHDGRYQNGRQRRMEDTMDHETCARIRGSAAFVELEQKRLRLGLILAALILIIYFGFVFLVAFAPGLLATPISGVITLGFPLGLGVILSAIVLTGFYVLRANSEFDRLTREIVEEAR
jgi:uncharacterized membrane protein (DUF485 family)